MRRAAILLSILLPALASAEAPPQGAPQVESAQPFEPSGVLVGVGYGLHRYFDSGLSAQDDGSPRSFDGQYLLAQVAWQGKSGGLVGVDFSDYSGSHCVQMPASRLTLSLHTQTVSALAGLTLGQRLRFHLAALAGVAFGSMERTFEAAGEVDRNRTAVSLLTYGGQLGLEVMPTDWLSLGARGRLTLTGDPSSAGTSKATADLGGIFLGLFASVVL